MFFYDKSPRQLLVDLINEANPSLPFAINAVDYDFAEMTPIELTAGGHNTQIRLIARPSAPYTGNVLLTYRRLHLANLFQGITPWVRKWVVNGGSTTATTVRAQLYDLLPLYAKKYGLVLDQDNIEDVALQERWGINDTDRFDLTAKVDSMIYTGSVPIQWIIGRREISDLLSIDEINGREYPGGNDFSNLETRPLYLTPIAYDVDFSMVNASGVSFNREGSGTMGLMNAAGNNLSRGPWYTGIYKALAPEYERVVGEALIMRLDGDANAAKHDITGFWIEVVSLPHVNYPEANSQYYNQMVVLKPHSRASWCIGNFYMHYNL